MGIAIARLHGCRSVCYVSDRALGACKKNASGRQAETRDGLSHCNHGAVRSAFLLVLLLADLLPVLYTTAGSFLLDDRKPFPLRNLVRRLTGRNVCDQLRDLSACVVARNRRMALATLRGSSSQ